jgi:EmrB/QacA subfamily drug resistance transporter
MTSRSRERSTLIIVSLALFMVVLDNLVVSVALTSIHRDFGSSVQSLEWTVNAYTLCYAVFLLIGATLGDRFGRRRMFVLGLSLFTLASAGAGLAPNVGLLIAARAIQGVGAAIVTPLTLTLLAETFAPERRGLALGVWSGISGTAVALGPLVGGGVIAALDWHWIFGINVPIGALLVPIAARRLAESHGPNSTLDVPGLALSGLGLLGLVYGFVHAQTAGFGAPVTIASLAAGVLAIAAFVRVELRTREPMLPMTFFTRRSFVFTNIATLAMYFGMFGAVFFLSQYLQLVLGNSALQAGLKLLLWTGSVMVVSPIAGVLSSRFGSRPFLVAGLVLQAAALTWIAATASTTTSYTTVIVPFIFGGSGMALVFAPSASAILASVRADQAGQASGAANAIREIGGVFGVAILATVFAGAGSYATGHSFVTGLIPALWVGVAVLGAAALLVAAVPWSSRQPAAQAPALGASVPIAG